MGKPIGRRSLSPECLEPNAAGIDVGAAEIYAAVSPDRDAEPVRGFKTFTSDFHEMGIRLTHHATSGCVSPAGFSSPG